MPCRSQTLSWGSGDMLGAPGSSCRKGSLWVQAAHANRSTWGWCNPPPPHGAKGVCIQYHQKAKLMKHRGFLS